MIAKKDLSVFREKQRILLKTNDFICLLPHQNLREYISNYNITFPTSILMPDSFTEMPCGCATLTVECCRSNLSVHLDGPTTRPHIVGNQANRLEILVTIEFKPAGFFALTGIPQNELTDVSLPFEAVNPKLCRLISQAVEKAGSICELADNLDLLLSESMHMVHQPQLSIALQTIINCSGNVNVKNLSADTHYSERQLNRIFNQQLGISVKSFSRLIRIHSAFHLLKNPNNSITFISDITGFHDLSHFVRDFRSVCGITPQAYRNNMSDFYINPMKF